MLNCWPQPKTQYSIERARTVSIQLGNTKFHGKEVSHWRGRVNSEDLTGDADADYISRTWSIYANIHGITRETTVYECNPGEKLSGCRVNGPEFAWGIPRDDPIRGLLWHAVYKPFWNEGAKHSCLAPSWSWVSLSQRVGWPDYSSGKVDWDVVHVENVKITDLPADGEALLSSREPRRVDSVQLCLSGEFVVATFKLHDDTERKGSLTGPALEKTLACTMDCDFRKRDVYVLKILTRELEGGLFCTHFLVLEAILPGKGQDDSNADTAEILEMNGTKSKLCRRVGTAKLSHRARDVCEFRRGFGRIVNIVIV